MLVGLVSLKEPLWATNDLVGAECTEQHCQVYTHTLIDVVLHGIIGGGLSVLGYFDLRDDVLFHIVSDKSIIHSVAVQLSQDHGL